MPFSDLDLEVGYFFSLKIFLVFIFNRVLLLPHRHQFQWPRLKTLTDGVPVWRSNLIVLCISLVIREMLNGAGGGGGGYTDG